MDDEQLRRRSALLAEALEREPAGMDAWLASLSPEDAGAVRRALARRGAPDAASDDLAGVSAGRYARLLAAAVDRDAKPADLSGERLGAWVLERKLGEGGMGEVWLASRADGLYEGKAAIKRLRADLDRGRVERRFAREREVLARLDHPNIARLVDAGLSERDEHPYLVLEYVEGPSLLAHVQAANPPARERVRLVAAVAEAVAYAHGRLVVHRDLKPQNILVTASGKPKVLDFGIAGLLDDDATGADALTRVAGRALTLEYSAPEQVTGAPADVRTDVFSLGVVLYELLAGRRPHAPREGTRRALEYAIVHDEAAALDAKRFDASLAAVLAKALAREPDARYATMAAFADDLRRWLDDRPVSAAAPTAWQRVALWSRRNRALSIASAVAVIAVVVGFAVAIGLAREAREQEAIALAALADAEQQSARAKAALARAESESARAEREAGNAREQAGVATAEGLNARRGEAKARVAEAQARQAGSAAQAEARKARAVSAFVFELFQAADPEKAKGEKLTARDVIDAGAEGLPRRFADQPDTLAELQRVLGTTYHALSRADKAIPLLAEAAKAQEAQFGKGSVERARTLLTLAGAEVETEKFADAVAHYAQALPVVEAKDGPVAESVVLAKANYSFALTKTGRTDEGLAMAEATAIEVRAKLGEDNWLHAEAQNARSTALSVVGRWREMPAVLLPLEPLLAKPPPGKLADALTIRTNLAVSLARMGDIQGAARRLGPLADEYAAYLGPEANRALVNRWFLAEYQRQLAQYRDCQAQYARLVDIRTRVTGATHPLTVDVLAKAALCAASAGDDVAARDYASRACAALPEKDEPPQRTVLRALIVLSNVALDLGDVTQARAMLQRAESLIAALKLETSDEWISVAAEQGSRLLAEGDAAGAVTHVEAAFATPTGQRALGSHSLRGMRAYQFALAGRGPEALAESAAARKLAVARLPANHPYFAALDYVDALSGAPVSPQAALAALEKSAGRPARLPLAPLWFTL